MASFTTTPWSCKLSERSRVLLLHLLLRGSLLGGKVPPALSSQLVLRWASRHRQARLLQPTRAIAPAAISHTSPGGRGPGPSEGLAVAFPLASGVWKRPTAPRPGHSAWKNLPHPLRAPQFNGFLFPISHPGRLTNQSVSSRSVTGTSSSHPYPWHLGEAPRTPERACV